MRRTLCFVFPLHQPPRSLNCGADASESLMAHAHLCACERPRFARGGRGIGFQTRRRAEGGQASFDLQCRHEGGAELSPQWIKSEPETPHACIQATAPTHSSSPCHPLLLSSPTIPLLLREPIPRPYPKMVPATLNIRSPPCTRPQGPRREPAVPSSCVRVKPRPRSPLVLLVGVPSHAAGSSISANGEPVSQDSEAAISIINTNLPSRHKRRRGGEAEDQKESWTGSGLRDLQAAVCCIQVRQLPKNLLYAS